MPNHLVTDGNEETRSDSEDVVGALDSDVEQVAKKLQQRWPPEARAVRGLLLLRLEPPQVWWSRDPAAGAPGPPGGGRSPDRRNSSGDQGETLATPLACVCERHWWWFGVNQPP